MADFDSNHPPIVVAVFDVTNGNVSVNGGPWTKFNVKKGREAPPLGEGDDGLECLFCNVHRSCRVHLVYGTTKQCLGGGCTGPLCP